MEQILLIIIGLLAVYMICRQFAKAKKEGTCGCSSCNCCDQKEDEHAQHK